MKLSDLIDEDLQPDDAPFLSALYNVLQDIWNDLTSTMRKHADQVLTTVTSCLETDAERPRPRYMPKSQFTEWTALPLAKKLELVKNAMRNAE